jgi:hypothetical protein
MASRSSILKVFSLLALRAATGQVLSKSELDCDFEVGLCAFVPSAYGGGGGRLKGNSSVGVGGGGGGGGGRTAGWLRNAGPTKTSATGPSVDHTTGNVDGSYVYAEQKGNKNTEFILDLDVGGPFPFQMVSFWYSMYGRHTTYLKFQSSVDGVTYTDLFEKFGEQTNSSTKWLFAEVEVDATTPNRPHYFRFAQMGSNNKADTAIDDFQVNYLPTSSPTLQVGGRDICSQHV